jgi:curli biogenesis system outer membrane secretion channel CsgG
MKQTALLLIAIALGACATAPQTATSAATPAPAAQAQPAAPPVPAGSRRLSVPLPARGLDCATAVKAGGKSEREGIAAENAWIKDNYPGAKKVGQELITCDNKLADLVKIETANGQKVSVFFDISDWFGKY